MKFIGHRGFRHRHPENTLRAFEAVCAHPCNGDSVAGIELDIQMTGDERVVVMHDTTVQTRQGEKVPIAMLTLERLRSLCGGFAHDASSPAPELSDVLELVNHRTALYVEIKEGAYDLERFIHVLRPMLEQYRPNNDIHISSFSPHILHRLAPTAKLLGTELGFLFHDWRQYKTLPSEVNRQLDTLHPEYRLCLSAPAPMGCVDLPLICWTVNSLSDVQSLTTLPGADRISAIITDDIDLAKRFPSF
ncbi:MAG: hypothetical protein GF344_02265 [Chitinivibrionales bacterium]|nr:hypothetical protein [Chitinivibrionales bacterium]MBD3355919.1 hypothetical protein [Chitinivibrionales bacterium]